MARPATGEVIERAGKRGTAFVLRFRAYGRRHHLTIGNTAEGFTRRDAEVELQNVLADVRRGIWKPAAPTAPVESRPDPTFHEFASEWFEAKRRELRESTESDYRTRLTVHLLPFFHRYRLSEVDVAAVDRYREQKVREADQRRRAIEAHRERAKTGVVAGPRPRSLSAETINKSLVLLGQVLDVADERALIDRNPMRMNPRRRKLKVSRPAAVWLDRAEQITALLDAAAELDREARPDRAHVTRRALLAVLSFAGLRLGELCGLRWRDVDLAAGRLWVRAGKTDAAARYVDLLPVLANELAVLSEHAAAEPNDPVFATSSGRPMGRDNVRNRVFAKAVDRANTRLVEVGRTPLPEGLTPHKLRHSFCSLLFALGKELPYVMSQLGHDDPNVTLRIYAHTMAQDGVERRRLREVVGVAPVQADGSVSPQERRVGVT